MKNRKGFTLIELLAVIAILAVLVIIALPNVIKMFNNAKKSSFLTEVQSVYKQSLTKSMSEEIGSNKINTITSLGTNKLDMQGKELTYCVILNEKGSPIKMAVSDGKYFYIKDSLSNISSITKEDVHEGTMTMNACAPADFGNISGTTSGGETIGQIPIDPSWAVSASAYSTGKIEILMNNMQNSALDSVKYKISYKNEGSSEFGLLEEGTMTNKSDGFRYTYYGYSTSGSYDYLVEAYTPDGRKIDETTARVDVVCFVAGTKVKTENGYKNIEEIKAGEKVYSYNFNNNSIELKEVIRTIKSSTIDTYIVTIDGKTVEMSPKHQVYVIDKGWVRAYDLKESDELLDSNRNKILIDKIEYKRYDEPINTYNLSIDGNSNYFVTDVQILVHNATVPSVVD